MRDCLYSVGIVETSAPFPDQRSANPVQR